MADVFYSNKVNKFIEQNEDEIFGIMSKNDAYDTVKNQKDAWEEQIKLLKRELRDFPAAGIIFEYTIPRIGGRIDNILLYNGIIFVIEFKVNSEVYPNHAIVQARSYALDLSNFHEESRNIKIVPILVATRAVSKKIVMETYKNNVIDVVLCNSSNIHNAIQEASRLFTNDSIDCNRWINSRYVPTPTIIEAAEILYNKHSVEEIAQNDAADNLDITSLAVQEIIEKSKRDKVKSICFITGVPGSGKTLAGLNIAINNQKTIGNDYACFLTGNQPLVTVLKEALAQDEHKRLKTPIGEARDKVKSFIQIIHHFRDTALRDIKSPPVDHVVIFDESQRAWNNKKLAAFMKDRKKSILSKLTPESQRKVLNMSEPELLIEYMDRHIDWAVIVCLVGGGQDIHVGEAGIGEWFDALKRHFLHWNIYISNQISSREYLGDSSFTELIAGLKSTINNDLHLSVSIRSFRSENVANFIEALLSVNKHEASRLYREIIQVYPILMTRDIAKAKSWAKEQAGDTLARYGLVASSKAKRLRAEGVWVECEIKPQKWFLEGKNHIKSSFFMEEVATEFDIQGLEIDWAVVCWDADFRYQNNRFSCFETGRSKWQNIKSNEAQRYLANAYRVLLTRARQGFIIYIPIGNANDETRLPKFYNGLYDYFKEIGLEEI